MSETFYVEVAVRMVFVMVEITIDALQSTCELDGKIFKPQFVVVNWTTADQKPLSVADDMNDEIPL